MFGGVMLATSFFAIMVHSYSPPSEPASPLRPASEVTTQIRHMVLLPTVHQAKEFISDSQYSVRAVAVAPTQPLQSGLFAAVEQVASQMTASVVFARVESTEVALYLNATDAAGQPQTCVILCKDFDEERVVLLRTAAQLTDTAAASFAVAEFISANLRPAINPLDPADPDSLAQLYNHNFVKLLLLLPAAMISPKTASTQGGYKNEEVPDEPAALIELVRKCVLPYKHKLLSFYVFSDAYDGFGPFFQIHDPTQLPSVVLFKSQLFHIFRYGPHALCMHTDVASQDVNLQECVGSVGTESLGNSRPISHPIHSEGLSAWLDQFWRGRLRPLYRSEAARSITPVGTDQTTVSALVVSNRRLPLKNVGHVHRIHDSTI
eukprot:SAG31_NODE_928_length_10927_cov_4.616273_2_plen_377_part_00